MLGDRCEDKAALEFSREAKSRSGGATGVLLPQAFQGEWIDNLRSFMVLEAAGMTTATMTDRTVTSSRVVSDPPVAWRAESTALAAGDPTFELRNLVARTLGVRVQSTVELAQDSPDFGSQLLNVMGKALAHEIDRVGLIGTGVANQPTGIVKTSGINSVSAIGTPSSFSPLVNGVQKLLENNVPLEIAERNAIMSPRTWGSLENLTATDNQPLMRPNSLDRMAFRPTNSIPNDLGTGTDESLAIMGDFRELVLGVRMEATVEALRLQSYADNLLLEFVGLTRVDFMVRRPASFVVLEGITA
ncbi:phage major capsid protein [Novosphingobium sp. BW1]|nr:phage major capsid protein [Novosphingobium sp. BW1]